MTALQKVEAAQKDYLIVNGWYRKVSGGHVEWACPFMEVTTDLDGAVTLQKKQDRQLVGHSRGSAPLSKTG